VSVIEFLPLSQIQFQLKPPLFPPQWTRWCRCPQRGGRFSKRPSRILTDLYSAKNLRRFGAKFEVGSATNFWIGKQAVWIRRSVMQSGILLNSYEMSEMIRNTNLIHNFEDNHIHFTMLFYSFKTMDDL
jgi:hypothetical protein